MRRSKRLPRPVPAPLHRRSIAGPRVRPSGSVPAVRKPAAPDDSRGAALGSQASRARKWPKSSLVAGLHGVRSGLTDVDRRYVVAPRRVGPGHASISELCSIKYIYEYGVMARSFRSAHSGAGAGLGSAPSPPGVLPPASRTGIQDRRSPGCRKQQGQPPTRLSTTGPRRRRRVAARRTPLPHRRVTAQTLPQPCSDSPHRRPDRPRKPPRPPEGEGAGGEGESTPFPKSPATEQFGTSCHRPSQGPLPPKHLPPSPRRGRV
jgi:hypothetical protein